MIHAHRWLRPSLWAALLLLVTACKAELTPEELVAAKADQTLRQLIAGMNARKLPVLKTLLVVTSTTGGAPRALRDSELSSIVYPNPPYTYAGTGGPGYMQLRDGRGEKHRVKLIVLGDQLKVVAARRSLAELAGAAGGAPGADVRVISFLEPATQ